MSAVPDRSEIGPYLGGCSSQERWERGPYLGGCSGQGRGACYGPAWVRQALGVGRFL
jgi:hypothetical protein